MMTARIGSVSSGTMRPEDLIPCFLEVLDDCLADVEDIQSFKSYSDRANAIETACESEDYFDSEDAQFDLEWLFDSIGNFAPPYFYFGTHPDDGADYGFWLSEGWEDDFDGLKVSDTSEVPQDYSGEVLHVNDHGNCTLYASENGKLTEVWAIV